VKNFTDKAVYHEDETKGVWQRILTKLVFVRLEVQDLRTVQVQKTIERSENADEILHRICLDYSTRSLTSMSMLDWNAMSEIGTP
jgi:hypothetical protein